MTQLLLRGKRGRHDVVNEQPGVLVTQRGGSRGVEHGSHREQVGVVHPVGGVETRLQLTAPGHHHGVEEGQESVDPLHCGLRECSSENLAALRTGGVRKICFKKVKGSQKTKTNNKLIIFKLSQTLFIYCLKLYLQVIKWLFNL